MKKIILLGFIIFLSCKEQTEIEVIGDIESEKNDLPYTIEIAKQIIEKNHKPDGFNIGMNCGESAGQTVFHFHCHLIPRYKGDMENPRGGVRHCVRGKGYY